MNSEQYNTTVAGSVWPIKLLPSPLKEYWAAGDHTAFAEWVTTYQMMHGLSVDGRLGNKTWRHLAIPCFWLSEIDIHGKGLWVWRLSQLDGGSLTADIGVRSAIKRMQRTGIKHVLLKVADGRSTMPGELLTAAKMIKKAGIAVFPWSFPYAYETDGPLHQQVEVHKNLAIQMREEVGSTVFVINAERGFLRRRSTTKGIVEPKHREHALLYTEGMRGAGMSLALSSYGLADNWSKNSFAWKELLENTDIWMPQSYWSVKSKYKNNPEKAMRLGASTWLEHWEKPGGTGIPIVPSGGCYQIRREVNGTRQWNASYHTPTGIKDFIEFSNQLRIPYGTFWFYMTPDKGSNARVTDEQWKALKDTAWWY